MGSDEEPSQRPAGRPELPATGVDEGPMRRELMRQIRAVELEMTRLKTANRRFEPSSTSPPRGPAVLSTAELEQVRDELIAARAELQDRIARLAAADLDAPNPRPRPLARLLRALRLR